MKRSTRLYAALAAVGVITIVWLRHRASQSPTAGLPYTSTPVYGFNPAGYNPQDQGDQSSSDYSSPDTTGSSDYSQPTAVAPQASTPYSGGTAYVGGQALSQSIFPSAPNVTGYSGTYVPGFTGNPGAIIGPPGLNPGGALVGASPGVGSAGGRPNIGSIVGHV